MKRWQIREAHKLGGEGSGNVGHVGRPGHRGGSMPKDGAISSTSPELITEIEMDESREIERFQQTADYLSDKLPPNEDGEQPDAAIIAEELADWAMDPQSRNGLIFQIAASQEFGSKLPSYIADKAKVAGIKISSDFSEERAILRSIHEKSSIRQPITLYRGTTQEESNPLESWTTDKGIAAFYVRRNGEGRVVERQFSPDQILATYREGIGLESAKEVVVLNR